jgi:hypothetical protein
MMFAEALSSRSDFVPGRSRLSGSEICFITVSLLGLYYLVFVLRSRTQHDHFHGPTPVPLLGNVETLRRLKLDPDGELLRIHEKWGKICALSFGTTPVIIISDPRAAKELLNEVRCPLYQTLHIPSLRCASEKCYLFLASKAE